MADIASITGTLVGFERSPYGAFVDRETGEKRPAGETLWVWVSAPAGEGAPCRIKCRADEFAGLEAAGWGGEATVWFSLTARKDLIVRQLQTFELVPPAAVA